MSTRDFPPRPRGAAPESSEHQGWLDSLGDRQNIDLLNTITPDVGDEIYLFDISGGVTGKATLTAILGLSGGATPGGSDTQVQFNDAGAFGGDDAFTWNKTTHVATVGTAATPGTIRAPDAGASAVGVALSILAGSAITANFGGGALNFTAGAGGPGNTAPGGAANITGGAAGTGASVGQGGAANLTGGLGTTVGGPVNIMSGDSAAATATGDVNIQTADMTGNGGLSGDINVKTGIPGTGGGTINLTTQACSFQGNGPDINLTTAPGFGSGFFGGNINQICGNGTNSGRGGNWLARGGDSPSGAGGNITLDPGTGGTTGNVIITAGANGQALNIKSKTELTTIAAAATTDTTITIPANAIAIAVSVRVTVAIPTATAFDYGIVGATTRYGTAIAVAANTTYGGTDDALRYYAGATAIRFTPNVQPANANGRVRTTIHYIDITPPTS